METVYSQRSLQSHIHRLSPSPTLTSILRGSDTKLDSVVRLLDDRSKVISVRNKAKAEIETARGRLLLMSSRIRVFPMMGNVGRAVNLLETSVSI